jgi:hypothetical protein
VEPHFFKLFFFELDVVNLVVVLAEHENLLFAGKQVLGVRPLHIEIVGAVVLALDVHEEDGVVLEGEGGNEAVVIAAVLAPVENLLAALAGDGDIDGLPLVLLGEVEVEEEILN